MLETVVKIHCKTLSLEQFTYDKLKPWTVSASDETLPNLNGKEQ